MNIALVTLFPAMFAAIEEFGITSRAVANGLVRLGYFNPRDFATDRHRTVDDRPYGGGPGMVMKVATLEAALGAAKSWLNQVNPQSRPFVVYLSPQGRLATQTLVSQWHNESRDLILIAGRYEGVDERFVAEFVDAECSIGDYVLSGGELPAMVLIDALVRLQPGALGASESAQQDSFANGLLDCPHYTRPEVYRGRKVPSVLLSGDHKAIAQWREAQALGRTAQRRPDLLASLDLSDAQQKLLRQFMAEQQVEDSEN